MGAPDDLAGSARPIVGLTLEAPEPVADTAAGSAATAGHDRCSPRESRRAALAAALFTIVQLAIAAVHGALGAARNDDWTYYNIAFRFAATGRFRLDGWTQALFAGQALMAWPVIKLFGNEIVPLQCAVAIAGGVGLWACYVVIRSMLPSRMAALSVACLAVGPLYGGLSTSFMTDVPAFALQMLTLLAGARALRSTGTVRWFAVAMALGLLAFSVREYAVAAGSAVAVVVIACHRRGDRRTVRRLLTIVALWVVLLVSLYLWRSTLDHGYTTHFELTLRSTASAARTGGRAALTLALLVFPAVAAMSPARLARLAWRRSPRGCILVAATWLAIAWFARTFLGNYLTPNSSYNVTLAGTSPRLLANWLWVGLHLVGYASLLMLGALAVVGWTSSTGAVSERLARGFAQPARALAGVFTTAAVALPLAAVALTDAPMFDRYLLPLVPFTAAFALRLGRSHRLLIRPARQAAGVGLLVLAAVGFAVVDATATVDGAKWRLSENVRSLGFAAASIDGGYEWFGLQQDGIVHPTTLVGEGSPLASSFGNQTICVVVRHTPRTASPELAVTHPAPGEPWRPGEIVARYHARSLVGIEYDLEAVATDAACVPDRVSGT